MDETGAVTFLIVSLFAVFPGELLCVFHKLLSVLKKLLSELGPQWVLGLGIIAQSDKSLNHYGEMEVA